MTGLLDLQRQLQGRISAEAPPAVQAPGMAVYRHAYRAQLVACLRDTFEKTWAWLGDQAFDMAAQAYVADNPPSAWTLADYGQGFADALVARWPEDPEVSELAWLDWALSRAFDGPGAEAVSLESLANVDWDRAVLSFLPTLAVGVATTNAAAIWTALAEEENPPPATRLPTAAAVRVWRTDLSPQYRAIEAPEADALRLAMTGADFATVCASMTAAGETGDDPAQAAGLLLASWMADGLITSVA